jgi:hypothetical protein
VDEKVRVLLFCKKRSKKTLASLTRVSGHRQILFVKVFWFFFKKELLTFTSYAAAKPPPV